MVVQSSTVPLEEKFQGVLKPDPHPHHYLEPGFGHSRHSQAGGMAEGGEEQRWGAKGPLHCLRPRAGSLGCPKDTKDDL